MNSISQLRSHEGKPHHLPCLNDCSFLGLTDLLPTFFSFTFFAVVSASLGALVTWVEWTPMQRITGSSVVDACAFFLDSADFRLQGLEVLKQVGYGSLPFMYF